MYQVEASKALLKPRLWAGRANPLPRVSFGISWFPQDGRDADALINAADARMYEDKARARTRATAAASVD